MKIMKTKNYLKVIYAIAVMLLLGNMAFAQETNPTDTLTDHVKKLNDDVSFLKKIQFSGYILAQYQSIDSAGAGSTEFYKSAGNVKNQFALREARIKLVYNGNLSQYVFQFDATERGVAIKDMYAKFTEPWLKTVSLTVGHMNRPFGFEIGYSSGDRESPERARMSQTIFPSERDLGAMLTFQAPKTSKWNPLKLEMGLYNGTGGANAAGTNLEFDSKKDFIGHLTYNKSLKNEKLNFGVGVSYYNGGWRDGSTDKYDMNNIAGVEQFVKTSNTSFIGSITKREYYGVDAQVNMDLPWGLATLRGEYITGSQPGTSSSSTSPQTAPTSTSNVTAKVVVPNGNYNKTKDTTYTVATGATTTTASPVYNRNFNGGYFYFIQNIAKTKFQVTVKYDWYDPNTKISGKQIGVKGSNTSSADIKYSTLGLGLAYKWDNNIKITAYYAMVQNEVTLLKGYEHEIPDNVFTLRLQYKF